MSEPLVSILIPTYNGERFLGAALRSALDQTHREIEVLVGDDASTDQTPAILAAACAADPRVRVLSHEHNVGAFENPVRLLDQARGDYVKFLLHDDVLAPECVEELLAGFRQPGVHLSFSHRSRIDEEGVAVAGQEFPRLSEQPGPLDGRQLGDFVLENMNNVIGELTTCMFRRADVDLATLWQIDGRDLAALGDLALWLSLLLKGPAFYTPRTLSHFRSHDGQRSRDPRVGAAAVRDWPRLIDWGRRHGLLAGAGQEHRAHSRALLNAAAAHANLPQSQAGAIALEAAFLSTARLMEMRTTVPTRRSSPLADRAHGPAVLGRLAQELDVWSRIHPVALAAPTLDPAEVLATVEAFREVQLRRAATRLMIAVDPGRLAEMMDLVGEALSRGRDIDIELTPTDDPLALLTDDWLAVAPRGNTWHRGRAAALWIVEPETPSSAAGPAG